MFVQPLFTRRVPGREWGRFVSCVKRLVRTSPEYKKFVGYCKSEWGMNRCSFLGDVTDDDGAEVEVHHAVLSLHDVVEIVADHIMSGGVGVTTLTVAHEVLRAHFAGLIPVAPLSRTAHQLVHSGQLAVHAGMLRGDLVGFLKTFNKGITAEHAAKVRDAVAITWSGAPLHPEGLLDRAADELEAPPAARQLLLEQLAEVLPALLTAGPGPEF